MLREHGRKLKQLLPPTPSSRGQSVATKCQREADLQRKTARVMHLVIKCPVNLGGRKQTSWKLEKIPAVSKSPKRHHYTWSIYLTFQKTHIINNYSRRQFLRTWSAHFGVFFPTCLWNQDITTLILSWRLRFTYTSTTDHLSITVRNTFFSTFVELNNKIEHVLQRGRLGSSLQASVPRYWKRRLPPPPYLFSAWLFAFTIKRQLHYLLEKQKNNVSTGGKDTVDALLNPPRIKWSE